MSKTLVKLSLTHIGTIMYSYNIHEDMIVCYVVLGVLAEYLEASDI